jgi:hypothetical protein
MTARPPNARDESPSSPECDSIASSEEPRGLIAPNAPSASQGVIHTRSQARPTQHGPCAGCQDVTLTCRAVRKGREVWLCVRCDNVVGALQASSPEQGSRYPARRRGSGGGQSCD